MKIKVTKRYWSDDTVTYRVTKGDNDQVVAITSDYESALRVYWDLREEAAKEPGLEYKDRVLKSFDSEEDKKSTNDQTTITMKELFVAKHGLQKLEKAMHGFTNEKVLYHIYILLKQIYSRATLSGPDGRTFSEALDLLYDWICVADEANELGRLDPNWKKEPSVKGDPSGWI